jgi:diaminohydroxyphosphoribosylaminopyrimidine deaminase/5-amino-6-(5-phosphoribosylamino)uracil reductase
MLTARPPGPRTAIRVIPDSTAQLPADSQLVRTAREIPVLVAAGPSAPRPRCRNLRQAGCEVLVGESADPQDRLHELLTELGRRRFTNLLVEGGGRLLGSLFDAGAIDEVHVFIAGKLVGGLHAPSPLGGRGRDVMSQAVSLAGTVTEALDDDIYVHGRLGDSPVSAAIVPVGNQDLPSARRQGDDSRSGASRERPCR